MWLFNTLEKYSRIVVLIKNETLLGALQKLAKKKKKEDGDAE
jgi:hypothetical protein